MEGSGDDLGQRILGIFGQSPKSAAPTPVLTAPAPAQDEDEPQVIVQKKRVSLDPAERITSLKTELDVRRPVQPPLKRQMSTGAETFMPRKSLDALDEGVQSCYGSMGCRPSFAGMPLDGRASSGGVCPERRTGRRRSSVSKLIRKSYEEEENEFVRCCMAHAVAEAERPVLVGPDSRCAILCRSRARANWMAASHSSTTSGLT